MYIILFVSCKQYKQLHFDIVLLFVMNIGIIIYYRFPRYTNADVLTHWPWSFISYLYKLNKVKQFEHLNTWNVLTLKNLSLRLILNRWTKSLCPSFNSSLRSRARQLLRTFSIKCFAASCWRNQESSRSLREENHLRTSRKFPRSCHSPARPPPSSW